MKHKTLSIFTLALQCGLMANPSNPQVTSGSATFDSSTPGVLNVTQSTDSAIINWQDFSIDLAETTNFIQPDVGSAVLNRVMSDNASSIMGSLNANGQVYLINPNGVIFGSDSVINTASFIASTLDLPDQLFLENGDLMFQGDSEGVIVNYGTIIAESGDVILIGYQVQNNGSIKAANGVGGLAVGQDVLIRPLADERIYIRPSNSSGEGMGVGLINAGDISALQTELKVDGNPFALAINHSGTMESSGVEGQGGGIYIVSKNGSIEISGSMMTIDGMGNGGGVLVEAQNILVDSSAIIDLDADLSGEGGTAVFHALESILLYGQISAQGGESQGNGGLIEVDSGLLSIEGNISTFAPAGQTGVLQLVSNDFEISAYPNFTTGTTIAVSYISNDTLAATLASNNLVLETSLDTQEGNGDITFNDPVNWTSPFSLNVEAFGDINVFSLLTSSDNGDIQLLAGRDINVGDPSGALTVPAQVGSALGDITLSAWRNLNVVSGSTSDSFAHVGFEGPVVDSDISIPFIGGDLNVVANTAFASIGHGAFNPVGGTKSGDIFVKDLNGDLNLTGGNDNAYAMLGHYHGDAVNGSSVTASGDIILPAVDGSVTVTGGLGANSFALIGYGGEVTADGDGFMGNIQVAALSDVSVLAGTGDGAFAAIGFTNGGAADAGDVTFFSDSLLVTSGGDATITSGSGANSFALIGGAAFNNTQGDTISIANLTVQTIGDVTISGGFGNASSIVGTQLDNGSAFCDLSLEAEDTITMTGNSGSAFVTNGSNVPYSDDPFAIEVNAKQGVFLNANDVADVFIQSIGTINVNAEDGDVVLSSTQGSSYIAANNETNISAGESIKLISTSSLSPSSITVSNDDLVLAAGEALLMGPFSYVQNLGANGITTFVSELEVDTIIIDTVDSSSYVEYGTTPSMEVDVSDYEP